MIRKTINSERIPIKLWIDEVEEGALKQAKNLANLPFAFRHIAIMPDCHEGYGMPIGGVLATNGVVIPNAVGVDIGCGMCAIKTSLPDVGTDVLKEVLGRVKQTIPLGFSHYKKPQDPNLMPSGYDVDKMPVTSREYHSALFQVGTLGGGNHFIEFQKGSDGHIWIMIHSGSRNIGKQVADHYNKLAGHLNERWGSPQTKTMQLAYLPIDSEQGQVYLMEMNYCIDFALANRKLMTTLVCEIFNEATRCDFIDFEGNNIINIAHNYAVKENHFGKDVFVHRKGATRAGKGQLGIIPGSQGTHSYIVRGKGNSESFESCSHGAGRLMGRKEAIRRLDLKTEVKKLEDKGILHSLHSPADLEEAASAYKDIIMVMQNQQDLVDILVELEPLAVVKG
ncbi:MAG: RtcB family protein [Bacteroidales bacterium]|nr:RtcB family protein [Bacteroidales bacterium]MDZ4204324.1 RtcB family protein [Bacteroidales bacterium]